MSTTRVNSPFGSAANLLDRLGVVDLVVPAVRARIQRIDAEDVVEEAVQYIRRNPEVLVVLLGSLTVTAGLIVYFMRRAEEEERQRARERTRGSSAASAKRRGAKKRRTSERKD